jgi:hypothetical protein
MSTPNAPITNVVPSAPIKENEPVIISRNLISKFDSCITVTIYSNGYDNKEEQPLTFTTMKYGDYTFHSFPNKKWFYCENIALVKKYRHFHYVDVITLDGMEFITLYGYTSKQLNGIYNEIPALTLKSPFEKSKPFSQGDVVLNDDPTTRTHFLEIQLEDKRIITIFMTEHGEFMGEWDDRIFPIQNIVRTNTLDELLNQMECTVDTIQSVADFFDPVDIESLPIDQPHDYYLNKKYRIT